MATRKRLGPKLRNLAKRIYEPRAEPEQAAVAATPARSITTPVRVLVATDASRAAGAAIKFASAMATTGTWEPEALTVVEHLPIAVAEVALPPAPLISEPEITQGILAAVKRQLRRFGGAEWTLRVQFGGAVPSIVEQAKQRRAGLIVLGLGRHGKLARLFGAETVARVVRLTDTPVLAVDANASAKPRRVVAAMDFGGSSVRAAKVARSLMPAGGHLHLVHVRWALNGQTINDPAWERTYALGVEQAFERLERELATEGIKITSKMRTGAVVESILDEARTMEADIISAGSHSQTVVDRLLLGSTPSQLLRAARCSVLIAPAETTPDA